MSEEIESSADQQTETGQESSAAPIPASAPVPTAAQTALHRRRRTVAVIALALLGIGLVAFAILGVRAFSSRMDAARKLDEATSLVQDADKLVVEIDEVVRAKVTPELAEKARGAKERVDGAESMLVEAVGLIDRAVPDLNDDERERAGLLKATAEARLAMLKPAPAILELNAQAASAMPLADKAWQSTLAADAYSDKAVAAYNKLTKAGVTNSQKLNKKASGELGLAREQFEAAEKAFSAAPFEQYLAYVDARIDLNRVSQQSDTAWLKGDIAKANSLIAKYNTEDRRAVALARQLPSTPGAAIAKAFESAAKTQSDAYYAAREAALVADRTLREY